VEGTVEALALRKLRKSFSSSVAVDGMDLTLSRGEFVSLLGPSGCGKSTVLRMIAGLLQPDSGEVLIEGKNVTALAVHKRNIGFVFQSYALFPHLSVFENVAFGLRRRRLAEADVQSRVTNVLETVRLHGLGDRRPSQLSGGQQQRVALARAVVTQPSLLLLDEPLSNLDALLREEMRLELKRLQHQLGITTLFVTHDQAEALAMSDRIAVVNGGRLEQIGTPEEIYAEPATQFVARFIGRSNFLTGHIEGDSGCRAVVRCAKDVRVVIEKRSAHVLTPGSVVRIAIRQERVQLTRAFVADTDNCFPVTVALRAYGGSVQHYILRLQSGAEIGAEVRAAEPALRPGDVAYAGWTARDGRILSGEGWSREG